MPPRTAGAAHGRPAFVFAWHLPLGVGCRLDGMGATSSVTGPPGVYSGLTYQDARQEREAKNSAKSGKGHVFMRNVRNLQKKPHGPPLLPFSHVSSSQSVAEYVRRTPASARHINVTKNTAVRPRFSLYVCDFKRRD